MSDPQARILERFAENPTDSAAFDAALDVLVEEGSWGRILEFFDLRAEELEDRELERHWRRGIDVLERVLNTLSEPEPRARLLCAIAFVWEEELERPDQALLGYQAAFRVDRTNDEAIHEARRIQSEQGNWLMVARSYQLQLQVQVPRDDEARAVLLAEAAAVHRTKLHDPTTADRFLADARALDPEIDEPSEGERPVVLGWQEQLEKLEAKLYGTRGTERADLLFEIAGILIDEPGDAVQAEPYVVEAQRLHPHSPSGLRLVAKFHQAREELDLYQKTLEKVAAGKGPVEVRSGALVELARFRGAAGDIDGSDAALRWALQLAPRSPEVLELAQERYRVTGNWGALTTALERSIEGGGRSSQAIDTHLALGEIYWRELDEVEKAERHFKRVRLSDGRNPRMLRFYVDYFGRRNDWSRVLSNLRALRTASPDEDSRIDIAAQMATIAEAHLSDPERATDIWTSARTEFPNSGRAAAELRRLLRAGGKWNRLVDLLKADVAALPADAIPEKVGLLTEMAHLYRDHFHLPVLVGNAYNQILQLEPTNEEACRALSARYSKAGRWTDLIALLERELDATDTPARRSGLLHRIGEVSRDSLKDPRAAARAYEAALEIRSNDSIAIEALKELYEKQDPEALFALRRRELSLLSESRRVTALAELVTMGERIGADDEAITELLESLHELSPSQEMGTKLKGLYHGQRRWEDLIRFSRHEVDSADVPDRDALRALALLLSEHEPDPWAEQQIWRRLVDSDPDDAEAVTMLADSLVAAGSWDELEIFAGERGEWKRLIVPLRAHAEASDDSGIWRRLARVSAERVDDRPGQIKALRRAWELDDSDPSSLSELENALALVGDHTGRAATLRELVRRTEGAERKELALRLASALSEELDEHQEAYGVLSEVYFADPTDAAVLRRTLDSAHQAEAVGELMRALKREAARMAAGPDRRAVYYAIVELGEGAAQSLLDAVDYLERIRAEDPYDPALVDRLIEVYAKAERWERLAELLEEVVREFDGDRKVGAVYRLVEVQSAFLRSEPNPVEAIRSHGLPATSSHGLRALREALVEREVWRPASEVADAEAASANNAADARVAQFAAAEALARANLEEGATRFAQLIADSPRSEEADTAASRLLAFSPQLDDPASWAAAAESAFEAHERWDDLVDAIEIQQTASPTDGRLRRLAMLHAERRSDSPTALRVLIRLGVDANQEDRELATRLARELGDVPTLVDAWRSHADGDVSVGFLSDLARLLDEDMEAADEARGVWRRAYEADPTSALAAEALERLNRSLDADEDLADHLISTAENAPPAEKAKRLREAAEILSRRDGRETEAVPLFERALDLSPRDLQSYDGLQQLYRRLGDDESLLDLLKRKISTFTDKPDVLASSLTTFGTAVFERGGGARVALHAYKKALTAEPHHRPTLDALQSMFLNDRSGLPESEQREVETLIVGGYRASADFESLMVFMEARLERATPEERGALHAEAAELSAGKLDDAPRAFLHWGAALSAGNANEAVVGNFAQLGRGLGSVQEVINQLEGVVDSEPSAGVVRTELIELYLEQGDRANAVRHLEVAATERPRDMQTVLRLEAIYRESGSDADTAAILMRKARGLPSEQAAEALREAAGLFHGVLGDPDQEADALLRLNRLEPDDDIDDRLQELLESLERWEELTAVLATRAHGVEGPYGTESRLRRAQILDEELGDIPRAIAAYRAVLEREAEEPFALARLDVLYGELGMAPERAAILDIRIRLAEDPIERSATRIELGRLAATELGDPDAGLALYRTTLEEEPSFRPALDALEEMALGEHGSPEALDLLVETHTRTGAFEEAIRVLSVAASVGARGRRVRLLDQARAIYENELRDADGAYAIALEAVYASQGNASVVAEARRLASGTQGWTRLAAALEDVAEVNPDPGGRTELLLLLGDILKNRLDRPSDAEEAYHDILTTEPHQRAALEALDEIYTQTGPSGAHTAVVDALLETVSDEAARVALLRRSAALHETEDDDIEASIDRYESVLEADPGDASTLARVRTLIRRTQNWPRLVTHLERILKIEGNAVGRAPVLLELASLRVHELGDADQALEPLEELLRTDPGNAQGRRLAETIIEDELCDEAETQGLLGSLVSIYRSNEQWHELSDALDLLARREPEPESGRLWFELAEVLENTLGERSRALASYGELLRIDPSSEPALDAMVRISMEEWTWTDLFDRMTTIANTPTTATEDRVRLLREVADLATEWANDEERALQALEDLIATDGRSPQVIGDLERIYHRRRDWTALGRLYSLQAANVGDAEAGELLRRAAAVQIDFAGDAARAADILRVAADLDDPNLRETLARLSVALQESAQWDALAELLRDRIETEGDQDEADRVRWELAHLRLVHLADPEGAVALLGPILNSPRVGAHAFELSVDVLRNARQSEPDPMAIDLATKLEPIARNLGRWGVVVDILTIRAMAAESPEQSAASLIDVANVQRRLGRARQEFAAVRAALALTPADDGLRDRLRGLGQAIGDIAIYRAALEHAAGEPRSDEAAALLIEASRIAEFEERDPHLATALLRRVVDCRPGDKQAVQELQRVSEVTGDFEALAVALRGRLALAVSEEERVELLERLVEITAEDEDRTVHLDLLADLTEAEPSRRNVDRLEEAAREECDAARLEQALVQRAHWGERGAVEELAELRVEEFGDLDGAIEVWREHAASSGEDIGAARALAVLFRETARHGELADALDRIARATDDKSEKLDCRAEGGRLRLEVLNEPSAALRLFGELAAADPTSLRAKKGLEALLEVESTAGGAARSLEPIAAQDGEHERRIELLDIMLESSSKPESQVETCIKMSTVAADELDDRQRAFEFAALALAFQPTNPVALHRMRETAIAADRLEELASELDLRASDCEPSEAALLHRLAGDLYRGPLEDPFAALGAYQRVLLLRPEDEETAVSFREVAFASGATDLYADVLTARSAELSGDAAASVCLELASFCETELADTERAFLNYRRVLELRPSNGEALAGVERIASLPGASTAMRDTFMDALSGSGDSERLLAFVSAAAESVDGEERAALLVRQAMLLEPQDPSRAVVAFLQALELAPLDRDAFAGAVRTASTPDEATRLIGIARDSLGSIRESSEQHERLAQVAGVARQAFTDTEVTEDLLRDALYVDPDRFETADELISLFVEERRKGDALASLAELAALASQSGVRTRYHRRRVDLAGGEDGSVLLDAVRAGVIDSEIASALAPRVGVDIEWREAVEALNEASEVSDAASREQILLAVAGISSLPSRAPDIAAEKYIEHFRLTSAPESVIKAIEVLKRADQSELLRSTARSLSASVPRDIAIVILMTAAQNDEKTEPDQAAKSFRLVLALEPQHEIARERFEALSLERGDVQGVVDLLREDLAQDVTRAGELHRQIAELARTKMGNLELAEEHLAAALAVAPADVAPLQAIVEFYESTDRPQDADAVIRSRLGGNLTPDRRAAMLELLAGLLSNRGDEEGALVALEDAFAAAPQSASLFEALTSRYEAAEDWTSLQTALYRAANATSADDSAALWMRLADVAEHRLEDPDLARTAIEEALASGAIADPLIERLLESYEVDLPDESDESLARAIRVTEARSDRDGLARLHFVRGRLFELRGDPAAAVQAYDSSYALSTSYPPTLMRLGELHYEAGRHAEALKTLRSALLHQHALANDGERVSLFLILGELRYRSGDETRAKDMYQRVLTFDPDNVVATDAIDAIDKGVPIF